MLDVGLWGDETLDVADRVRWGEFVCADEVGVAVDGAGIVEPGLPESTKMSSILLPGEGRGLMTSWCFLAGLRNHLPSTCVHNVRVHVRGASFTFLSTLEDDAVGRSEEDGEPVALGGGRWVAVGVSFMDTDGDRVKETPRVGEEEQSRNSSVRRVETTFETPWEHSLVYWSADLTKLGLRGFNASRYTHGTVHGWCQGSCERGGASGTGENRHIVDRHVRPEHLA
eukprot:gene19561-biopygen787